MADFAETIATAYATDGAAVDLGRGVHDGAVALDATVKLPLRMVNRHGLIAGATGTAAARSARSRSADRAGPPRSPPVVGHVRPHWAALRDARMVEPGDLGQPDAPHHGLGRLVEHGSHGPDLVQADAVEGHRERSPRGLGGVAVVPGRPGQPPANLDAARARHVVGHRVEAGKTDELPG